ncbi:arsenate reductase [Salipiger sp. IMCC34102]|uniref:arsenate reductase family protein n=1 Tax=Salipiger sp. IMCC34102 TaxID=2510647 RepID=UPI00101BF8ED|nr:ArsC/Spx/MgsR family protein [Salipiger sp. IMCC34102]RYH02322.1 arsenate reductase [Salipiger sp. IMCC34102]
MRVYALKNCDTCRKALKALRAAGHDPEVRDIRQEGIAPDDLEALSSQLGEAALNRASTTWRQLPETARTGRTTDLIAAHPTLLKRPAIKRDGTWTVGWSTATQSEYLD